MSIKVRQVNLAEVTDNLDDAFGNQQLLTCSFCEKNTTLSPLSRGLCEKLSKPQELFCKFCLRNDLTAKDNKHILILTFRSAFGYFYHSYYRSKKRSIYFSQLQDYVQSHQEIGLLNPVFRYDPDSFLWFVDFRKVGSTGRKLPVEEVHKTVCNILVCFNLKDVIPTFNMSKFFLKYKDAIDLFYSQRLRPEGKRILSPTFQHCGPPDTKEPIWDKIRDFSLQDMVA